MAFSIEIRKKAAKALSKLPPNDQKRIVKKIKSLETNPTPTASRQLVGRPGFRLRIGDYRVIYEIFEDRLIILVLDLGHRKDIYR